MTKQEIREAVWKLLQSEHVARFPGARGRIPNFTGAEKCADRVSELKVWKAAPLESDTLMGVADYLITPKRVYVETPLLCVAEAKRDDFVLRVEQT